ncbi:MAG TPA: MgtC/SapB family protein [bacterium]
MLIDDILKLLLSILLGGLIGAEREYQDKSAGFRTLISISTGATLFTIFSFKIGGDHDPRIASSVVSGIGFLGAGVILREKGRVVGLTTAAMIWLTAAIGMGVGAGQYLLSCVTAAIFLIILWLFPWLEEKIDRMRETRCYEINCSMKQEKLNELREIFQSNELSVKSSKSVRKVDQMICTLVAVGSPKNHEKVRKQLFADRDVQSFDF